MPVETITRSNITTRNGVKEIKQYVTPNFRLLLSESGQQLLQSDSNVRSLLRGYRGDFEQKRGEGGQTRRRLVEGNEGHIFSMGEKMVVKEYHLPFLDTHEDWPVEKQVAFLRDTLMRAEQLRTFCEEEAPEHIRVPHHYAFLELPLEKTNNLRECFLLMERVNGVTLEEFAKATTYTDEGKAYRIPDYLRRQVTQDWETDLQDLAKWDIPRTDPHFSEGALVTDLLPRNVMIDFSSPTSQRPYTLWLIDQ